MDTVLEKKWEVYALKYAERTDRTRKESFIFDDHSHEAHTIDEKVSIQEYLKGIEIFKATLQHLKRLHDKKLQ